MKHSQPERPNDNNIRNTDNTIEYEGITYFFRPTGIWFLQEGKQTSLKDADRLKELIEQVPDQEVYIKALIIAILTLKNQDRIQEEEVERIWMYFEPTETQLISVHESPDASNCPPYALSCAKQVMKLLLMLPTLFANDDEDHDDFLDLLKTMGQWRYDQRIRFQQKTHPEKYPELRYAKLREQSDLYEFSTRAFSSEKKQYRTIYQLISCIEKYIFSLKKIDGTVAYNTISVANNTLDIQSTCRLSLDLQNLLFGIILKNKTGHTDKCTNPNIPTPIALTTIPLFLFPMETVNHYEIYHTNSQILNNQVIPILKELFKECLVPLTERSEHNISKKLRDIATFEWLFQQASPHYRGTPTIIKVLTSALCLYHQFYPTQKLTHNDATCFLSFSSTLTDYLKNWVRFSPYAPKGIQIHAAENEALCSGKLGQEEEHVTLVESFREIILHSTRAPSIIELISQTRYQPLQSNIFLFLCRHNLLDQCQPSPSIDQALISSTIPSGLLKGTTVFDQLTRHESMLQLLLQHPNLLKHVTTEAMNAIHPVTGETAFSELVSKPSGRKLLEQHSKLLTLVKAQGMSAVVQSGPYKGVTAFYWMAANESTRQLLLQHPNLLKHVTAGAMNALHPETGETASSHLAGTPTGRTLLGRHTDLLGLINAQGMSSLVRSGPGRGTCTFYWMAVSEPMKQLLLKHSYLLEHVTAEAMNAINPSTGKTTFSELISKPSGQQLLAQHPKLLKRVDFYWIANNELARQLLLKHSSLLGHVAVTPEAMNAMHPVTRETAFGALVRTSSGQELLTQHPKLLELVNEQGMNALKQHPELLKLANRQDMSAVAQSGADESTTKETQNHCSLFLNKNPPLTQNQELGTRNQEPGTNENNFWT